MPGKYYHTAISLALALQDKLIVGIVQTKLTEYSYNFRQLSFSFGLNQLQYMPHYQNPTSLVL